MATESDEDVGTILRSILTSEKSGIPLRRLEGEYRMLTGSSIPYRQLGFSTLLLYLESIPDVVRFSRNAQGETMVNAVVSASTAHVAQMVRGQKSTKSKPVVRKTFRRPMTQQHVGYRPNSLLTTLSQAISKPVSSTSSGERRRSGYEVYRPPAQRGVMTSHAKQSGAYSRHKQDLSTVRKSGSSPKNLNHNALAPEQRHGLRFEAPPRFQKAVSPRSNEKSKPNAESSVAEWLSTDEQSKPFGSGKGGWGELNSSWVLPAITTRSAADHWEFGVGGGDTGYSCSSTTGPAAAVRGGCEEPAQPMATATASKSLGSTRALEPLAAPTPVVTPLQPVITSKRNERRPSREPDQDRFNPFRQPLQLDLIPPSLMPEETVPSPAVSAPAVPAPAVPPPVSRELGISLRSAMSAPKAPAMSSSQLAHVSLTPASSKELGISLQSLTAARALTRSTSQPVHVSVTGPSLLRDTSVSKELGISLQSLTSASKPLSISPSQPVHVSVTAPTVVRNTSISKELGISFQSLASGSKSLSISASQAAHISETAPVGQSTLMPSSSGSARKSPTGDCMEPDPPTPNCQLVLAYARHKGLPHLYSTMQHRGQAKKDLVWLAALQLGDRKFRSYPEETATPEEAKEIAATRAVAELRLHPQVATQVRPVTPASSAEEVATLVKNIASLVIDKPTGILKEGIGPLYEETFAEQLSPSWFEHVSNSGLFHIERGRYHCILYPLSNAGRSSPAQNGHDVASDHNSSASNSTGEPDTSMDYVDVFVTCVISTDKVFFRFIDYDVMYNELLEEMAAFYNDCMGRAVVRDAIRVGGNTLYATLHDERWVRVQAVALHNEGQKIECYFVDNGNTSFLEPEALFELDSDFALLPLQAIQCQLDGLVEYGSYDGVASVLSDVLLGKTLVAEIINKDEPASVVMYDTWGPEDVDLNNVVFQRLMKPKLPERGSIGRCYLSHISSDGLIWVQISGPGLSVLNKFMHAVNEYCKNNSEGVDNPEFGKVYASYYQMDRTYYRAVLASPEPLSSGQFRLQYVDFGNEGQAFLSELRNVDNLGDFVVRLPYQALQCRLRHLTPADGVHWSEKHLAALLDIIGADTPELLIKVTETANDTEPAVVELFKRHTETRQLSCINNELLTAMHL